METKQRPTTVTAVDADLRAKAQKRLLFRALGERDRLHYLLGMCEALLAEANAHIERMERGERVR